MIHKFIIVEGIDRVGKTTLCRKLLEKYNNLSLYKHDEKIIKYSEMTNDSETETMKRMLLAEPKNIIFDRFHMSDAVYGIIHRNYNFINALSNFKYLNDLIYLYSGIVILIKPEDLDRSSSEHGSDLSWHNDLFNFFFDELTCDKCVVNGYNDIDRFLKEVLL